jgi:glycosyltransferase involved in cell wall biosynthesis
VHEEAVFWVAPLRPLLKTPILYDMHSSLPEQLDNFSARGFRIFRPLFRYLERLALQRSDALIVVCKSLEERIRQLGYCGPLALIDNLPVQHSYPEASPEQTETFKAQHGLLGKTLLVYTGTLGRNQGIELAIDATAQISRHHPEVHLVLVGGVGADLARVREYAALRAPLHTSILGQLPPDAMPVVMAAADVLISPRTTGTNTPLKIYSYLAARRPIVATALYTHLQVLDENCAILVRPEPGALAEGVLTALRDPELASAKASHAYQIYLQRYGIDVYTRKLTRLLSLLSSKTASSSCAAS